MDDSNQNEFPETILLSELEATHPEYNPIDPVTGMGILDEYEDLYKGGQGFKKHLEHYLIKRSIEGPKSAPSGNRPGINPLSSGSKFADTAAGLQAMDAAQKGGGGNAGALQWECRKRQSGYTPDVASVLDFMAAAVHQNGPSIEAGIVGEESNQIMEFWKRFNTNADGYGQDIASLSIASLLEAMIHKRAYLAVRFPQVAAESVGEQEAKGGLDAKVCLWKARFVDDWECDAEGNLIWLRTHLKQAVRGTSWGAFDSTLHRWRFVTPNAIYQYEIQYKDSEKPSPESTQVKRTKIEKNPLGALPVVPIHINSNLWVMDRLADTVLALFNRRSAATWTLNQMAFALLIVRSGKTIDSIACDDIAGLLLDPGDGASFESPAPAIFEAQQKDIERLKTELFSCLHMMALQAMKDKGGNPASGNAKEIDLAGMSTLLEAYAAPMKDALEAVVKIIQKVRGEGKFPLTVHGLNKFDVQSTGGKINTATLFLALPDLPESARKWVLLDTSLAMTANAPADVRDAVKSEMQKAKLSTPEVPAAVPIQKKPIQGAA